MADYEAAIDAALGEAQGLLETFSALLRIAQVEGASPRAGFTDVDLTAVTEAVSDAYRLDAEDADHQLIATISEGVVVSGDQELLTQALANLVENALRHTHRRARISASASRAAPKPVRCCWSRMTGLPWRRPTCRA
jgi:signal transduction histidine kinase